jgi:hypothetical protein
MRKTNGGILTAEVEGVGSLTVALNARGLQREASGTTSCRRRRRPHGALRGAGVVERAAARRQVQARPPTASCLTPSGFALGTTPMIGDGGQPVVGGEATTWQSGAKAAPVSPREEVCVGVTDERVGSHGPALR